MLEPVSDLSHQTHAVRSGVWPSAGPSAQHYDRIARDPRYSHFVRIPGRIVRCLDYFKVTCDRLAAARILSAYYIFIAVVDNAIDSGDSQTAATVFAQMAKLIPANLSELSDVALITEHLKRQLDDQVGLPFRNQLALLYETVCREQAAVSIETYLEARKAVGRLTADLSYLAISPLLDCDHKPLRAFMQEVGAVGCLVDSVIDLASDQRRGLVSFAPSLRDYAQLALVALFEGLSIGLRHPRLAGLFTLAILDDVRDRFAASPELSDNGQITPAVSR